MKPSSFRVAQNFDLKNAVQGEWTCVLKVGGETCTCLENMRYVQVTVFNQAPGRSYSRLFPF